MQNINFIPADEFLKFLKENNLVIGRASDFVGNLEFDLQVKRANLRKAKAASLKQVLEAKILPVKSKTAIKYWMSEGKFKEGETYKCAKTNRLMILTSALIRMGYL